MEDSPLLRSMDRASDTSSVVLLRGVTVLACTIGQIWADSKTLGIVSAAAFVCFVFLCAMIGLKWPYFGKLLQGKVPDGITYSCNGAVLGSFLGAFLALGALHKLTSWPSVAVPFVAASLVYYLVGKISCLRFRCCEAARTHGVRLPIIELVISGCVLAAVVIAANIAAVSPLYILAFAAVAFALLRTFSRIQRDHGLMRCVKSVDVVGLLLLSALWLLLAVRSVAQG